MSESVNWYQTDEELHRTYKLLCKKIHPDRNTGHDTTKEFQNLQALYEQIQKYRQNPQHIDLSVSLSEIYHGCIKDIAVPDPTNPPFNQTLPVFIPVGTIGGTVITLTTGQYGKVHVHIKEVNDTKFGRDGYNLIVYLDITLTQALINDYVTIAHFNGTVAIPTLIPHTNYRHIIPGMGMPMPHRSGAPSAGDLYVVYNIILPKDIEPDLLLELSYSRT